MKLSYLQERCLGSIEKSGAKYIIGIDEVGLGAFAGPFYVAGAVFEADWSDVRVKDSKKYHATKSKTAHKIREEVKDKIIDKSAIHTTYVATSPNEIDKLGMAKILTTSFHSLARCLKDEYPDSIIVIDGEHYPDVVGPVFSMPKADELVPAVSAASVVAKVYRDSVMLVMAELYPNYGFERNMGYGTKEHRTALEKYGPCPIHRLSYLKNKYGRRCENSS